MHYRQLGFPEEQIVEMIQGLTHDDLLAAWEYSADHLEEIEEAIRLNEEA